MGISGIGIWQLLIILVIVIAIFGTKRLRNMGGDLGSAVKGFRKAMGDEETKNLEQPQSKQQTPNPDAQASSTKDSKD